MTDWSVRDGGSHKAGATSTVFRVGKRFAPRGGEGGVDFPAKASTAEPSPGKRKLFIKPLPKRGLHITGLCPLAPGRPCTSSIPILQASKLGGWRAQSSLGEQGPPKEASEEGQDCARQPKPLRGSPPLEMARSTAHPQAPESPLSSGLQAPASLTQRVVSPSCQAQAPRTPQHTSGHHKNTCFKVCRH